MNLLRTLIFASILALLIGNDDVSCGNKKKQGKAHKASSSKQKEKHVVVSTVEDISSSYIEDLKAKNYPCLYDKTLFTSLSVNESKKKKKDVREYYSDILNKCRIEFDQIIERWIEKQGEFGKAIKIWMVSVGRLLLDPRNTLIPILSMEKIRSITSIREIIVEPFKQLYNMRRELHEMVTTGASKNIREFKVTNVDQLQWLAYEFGSGLCNVAKEEPIKTIIERIRSIATDIKTSNSEVRRDKLTEFYWNILVPKSLDQLTLTGRLVIISQVCTNLNYYDSEQRELAYGIRNESGVTVKSRSERCCSFFSDSIVERCNKFQETRLADDPEIEHSVESLADEFRCSDIEDDLLNTISKSLQEQNLETINLNHNSPPPTMQENDLCNTWILLPLQEALKCNKLNQGSSKRFNFMSLVTVANNLISACLIKYHGNIEHALRPVLETAEYKRVRKFIDGLVDYIRGYKGKEDVKFTRDESGEIRVVKPESSESTSVAGSTTDENNRQYVSYMKLLNVRGSETRAIELEFFYKYKIEGFDLIQAYLDGSQICELFETDQWKKLINTENRVLTTFSLLNDLYRSPVLRSSYAHEVLDLFDLWTICKQITLLPLGIATSSS